MVGNKFLLEGLISGFGEHRLLFKDGPETHFHLKECDGSLQIHTKVNESPLNTFFLVFFLLQNEHVVVEELLQLLISKVNGDLLKTIEFENLKTSNIKYTNEMVTFKS